MVRPGLIKAGKQAEHVKPLSPRRPGKLRDLLTRETLPGARLRSFPRTSLPPPRTPQPSRLTQRPAGTRQPRARAPALTPAGRRGLARALPPAPPPSPRHVMAAGLAPAGAAPPVTGSRRGAVFPPLPRLPPPPHPPNSPFPFPPPPLARARGTSRAPPRARPLAGRRPARAAQRPLPRGWGVRPRESHCPAASGRRTPRTGHRHLPFPGWAKPTAVPRGLPSLRPPSRRLCGRYPPPPWAAAASSPSSLPRPRRTEPEPAASPLPARGSHYFPVVPRAPRPAPKPGERGSSPPCLVRHGPRPRGASEARFLTDVHAPSPEPPLRNSARERSPPSSSSHPQRPPLPKTPPPPPPCSSSGF